MNVLVRNIRDDDLEAVVTIAVTGWQSAYRGIVDDDYLDKLDVDDTISKWKSRDFKNGCVVAELDGTIVGFANYSDEAEDDGFDSELWALYVKPDMKGLGIGTALVEYVKEVFRRQGKEKMVIWCFKDNIPSRKFYEKVGGSLLPYEKDDERGGKIYKSVGFSYDL